LEKTVGEIVIAGPGPLPLFAPLILKHFGEHQARRQKRHPLCGWRFVSRLRTILNRFLGHWPPKIFEP
jgi:hypothetical protein